jgi:hypothetical protein
MNMLRFLPRFIFLFAAAFCGICLAQTQPSTLPELPPGPPMTEDELPDAALRGDVYVVIALDLETGDKTAWSNAVMVITGGRPSTRPLGPDDPLPMGIDPGLGPFFKMGAQRLVFAVSIDSGNVDGVVGLRVKDAAGETAANDWLRKNARAGSKFTKEGAWLVTRLDMNSGRPVRANPPTSSKADDIRLALNCCGDDMPIKVAFVMSEPVKHAMMQGGPPPVPLDAISDLYWAAKYIYIGAKLGADPSMEARWAAPDSDGADAVIRALDTMHQQLKRPNGNFPGIIPFFAPIMEQCHLVREDNVVRVSLSQAQLRTIFTGILVASMARSNNNNGQQGVTQTPVAANWSPIDPATDAASSQMRLILSAVAEYDRLNNALPATLDDLVSAKLVPGPEIFHDPRTSSDTGFVYVRPDNTTKLADIKSPAKTPILYEQKDGQPDQAGLIGYADGTVKLAK